MYILLSNAGLLNLVAASPDMIVFSIRFGVEWSSSSITTTETRSDEVSVSVWMLAAAARRRAVFPAVRAVQSNEDVGLTGPASLHKIPR